MAPPKNPNPFAHHLCFLLLVSTTTLAAAVYSTSYSTLCPSQSYAPDLQTDGDDAQSLISSFKLSTGYFPGGGDSLFSSDSDDDLFNPRSFYLHPHGASRTTDPTLVHLTATLSISGPRNATYQSRGRRRRYSYSITQYISFVLDGYYSYDSSELCMVGTGTEFAVSDGSMKHYTGVALRLRVPSPSKLTDPFITGSLEGSDFKAIYLVSYAEDDHSYTYSERASCPPANPAATARSPLQALGANFSCADLKKQLMSSYALEYGGSAHASSSGNSPLLRKHEARMHVNQMQCAANGSVRAYVVFSNDTEKRRGYPYHYQQHSFLVEEEAVVAEGHWDSAQSMLCLRACRVRVARSGPSSLAVAKRECGIGMSFWFPAEWTIRDRSVVAGMLWDSQVAGNDANARILSGVVSASSIDVDIDNYRSNLSDVKYNYNGTIVEEARKQYLKYITRLGSNKKKMKGSFPGNDTYHDFEFRFYERKEMGSGEAYPVTIGSVMVHGDRPAADDSFSRHADAVVDTKQDLLNVSYDIRHYAPPDNWVRPTNGSYGVTLQERRISAEGVYDPNRGILCMIGCREHNGSTDCQMLVTVQFKDAKAQARGWGVIRSMRDKNDRLFFQEMRIDLYGMYTEQMSEAISRMDMETIMQVTSATLSCVFTVLQILHTKKNPEAATTTSITMLVILALGYLTRLVLNFEVLFMSRMKQYFPFSRYGWLDLNEVMVRAPTLVAFVLQLRLLQLAWSGRSSADQSKPETTSSAAAAAAERKAIQVCLPLYLIGAALAAIVHAVNARAANENPLVGDQGTGTIWEDLVSYAGLILDGFLLPQVVMNAASGSRARAISPWFYVGGTVVRAMPHVYDVIRAQNYVPSVSASYVYASPRGDLYGLAWDVVIPCGAALLALLLFLQQRQLGGALSLRSQRGRSGGYEMVSSLQLETGQL